MDNRKTTIIKNTVLLGIGSFSTKLLSFIMVPLYTYYISPKEYGQVDIYITILSMLYIVISLQSIESSFRFIQDCKDEEDKSIALTNAFFISLVGILFFSLIMIIIEMRIDFEYTTIFILYTTTAIWYNLFLHTIRAMKQMVVFTAVGIVSTFIQFAANIYFVVSISLGNVSLLISPIITNIICLILLFYKTNILKYVNLNKVSISEIKRHLHYSLPLIPNSIGIWLMSSIGRIILLYYYGEEEVGLLAFTLKFPLLLESLSSIFFLAWQVSAISEYDSEDRDEFATDIFNQFSIFLLSTILVLLPMIKITIFYLMGESYIKSWIYVPIFLIGLIFHSFAQFFSMGFLGAKKTKGMFYSVAIANIVFLLIGFVLANSMKIMGIGIAYAIAELVYFLYIKNKVSPYLCIEINYKKHFVYFSCILGVIYCYYAFNVMFQLVPFIIGLVIIVISNKQLILRIVKATKK